MKSTYNAPGVYINESYGLPSSVHPIKTAVPVFVGYTEFCQAENKNIPIKVKSLFEFIYLFGEAPQPKNIKISSLNPINVQLQASDYKMFNSICLFFVNGGSECYIVSVGDYTNEIAINDMIAGLQKVEQDDEPTLLLFPDGVSLDVVELKDLQIAALAQCGKLKDRFTILDVKELPASSTKTKIVNSCETFRENIVLSNLKYGAAYYPYLKGKFIYQYRFSDINNALKKVPTLTDGFKSIYADNVALVSKIEDFEEYSNDKNNSKENILIEENYLLKQLPIYSTIISELKKVTTTLPPSGAIVGIYAHTDIYHGVWKAPANVRIKSIIGLNDEIDSSLNEYMNIHKSGISINAIREFIGKGFLVWGARTLAGNSNDWRYVNVCRLANMIEESTKIACMQFIFEPNEKQTWVNIKTMIENFMNNLWKDGAFAGSKKEQAFFVCIGFNQTMTELDIQEGRLIVEIGFAPIRPTEFIILRFTQLQNQ